MKQKSMQDDLKAARHVVAAKKQALAKPAQVKQKKGKKLK